MNSQFIGILGAQHTGKRWLATALVQANAKLQVAPLAHANEAAACPIVLLMGLDLPTPMLGQMQEDTQLRRTLADAGVSFHVVYGTGAERLLQAQRAILRSLGGAADLHGNTAGTGGSSSSTGHDAWQWSCDKCSDPACEHHLFSGLLAGQDSI